MVVKTRIEIRNLILNSDLFEIKTVANGNQVPCGVYRLKSDKTISSKTIPNINVRHFVSRLEQIIFSYHNPANRNLQTEIEELANDQLKDIENFLSECSLTEAEIKKYFPKIYAAQFKALIKKKIVETGAFKENIERLRRYNKLYDPLFNAFHQYIYPNKTTKDIIYHHMAHALTQCKVINQSNPQNGESAAWQHLIPVEESTPFRSMAAPDSGTRQQVFVI